MLNGIYRAVKGHRCPLTDSGNAVEYMNGEQGTWCDGTLSEYTHIGSPYFLTIVVLTLKLPITTIVVCFAIYL